MDETNSPAVRGNGAGGATTARQGFGEQAIERRDSAATAMAERARAEVQARYIVALQRPRDVLEFRSRLLNHCKRPGFAAKARYRKPVGSSTIEGPSIRFVETALAEYSNVVPESSIVFEDGDQLIVRVTVTDLERNITHAAEATIAKRVERRTLRRGQHALSQRVNSYGETVFLVEATDDDVANLRGARESKLLRNLGLRILPADVVDEAMDLCIKTATVRGAADPTAERKRMADAFFVVGVSPSQLAAYLGHPLEQTQPAELVELREVYQAIRDGETSWSAVMESAGQEAEPAEPARGVAAAKRHLRSKRAQAAPAPAPTPTDKEDPISGEVNAIKSSLERILEHPEWLHGLRARVDALPLNERQPLREILARAELALEADRRADDIPDFDTSDEEGSR